MNTMNSIPFLVSCYESVGVTAKNAVRYIVSDRLNAKNARYGQGNAARRRARGFTPKQDDGRYELNWKTLNRVCDREEA